ncbi:MAG: acyloxyacyl hydrolase [Chitinophagaceae bacterium]|nr:acyloxyacyl hydrolase [Chitinophagaceae bacterium]
MKNVSLSILLYCFIFLSATKAVAQNDADSLKNYSLGVNYFGGKILVHTDKIHVSAPPYSQALEFNFNKQTLGNAAWQQRFGFPETGLSICVARHGSPLLGTAVGLYPSIQFRILQFGKGYWYFKIGGGIGVNSKRWQRTPAADSVNNIIGSTVNNFTMLQSGIRFALSQQWTLQTGVHFYHISNAGARKPNFGINTMGAHLGLNYHLQGFKLNIEKRPDEIREKSLNLGVQSVVSFAEDKTVDGPVYGNYNFAVFAAKMYRGKNRFSLGAEGTYNSKLYALFKNTGQFTGQERKHAWQYSCFAAHEFVFGKIGLPLQLGYYLNKPNGGAPIYEKLGITYHFYHRPKNGVKDLYLTTQLKTHYATADFAEFGLGVLF